MSESCTLPAPVPIAIAVVQRAAEVLIGPRGPDVALAGLWEFPGGKMWPGETPAAAAVRECREETGLDVVVVETISVVEHCYASEPSGRGSKSPLIVRLHFLACRPRDPSAVPMAPFRWVPRRELNRYEFPAANVAVVANLVRLGDSTVDER